jgi:SNF2-related domain/Helicase conserved C-terminal domain
VSAGFGCRACQGGSRRYIQRVVDVFELLDPQSAQEFLRDFEPGDRRLGESLFRNGSVQELVSLDVGLSYRAAVECGGSEGPVRVTLSYSPLEGWSNDCSCSAAKDCGHAYAAMCALLAEHSSAVVRGLSSGQGLSGGSSRGRGGPEQAMGVAQALSQALGRALVAEEKRFADKVKSAYLNWRRTRHLGPWHFESMGLARPQGIGEAEDFAGWPVFPGGELEFWCSVACVAEEHGVPIPKFMQPITDVTQAREHLARWRRGLEIERWKSTLRELASDARLATKAAPVDVDLRLVIEAKAAVLQWRLGDAQVFKPLQPAELSLLCQDINGTRFRFSTQAEILWHLLSQSLYSPAELAYTNEQSQWVLGRVLKVRALEAQVVTGAGVPLALPAIPLRWHLEPAADPQDDYRLSLVHGDGTPANSILSVFPGPPALYLASDAIYQGPAPLGEEFASAGETRIPAPALERVSGVMLLQSLGIDLPPRLRERVRTLALQVSIRCQLAELRPGARSEECLVTVVAVAADGFGETLVGGQWMEGGGGARKGRRDGAITIYDRSGLDGVIPLLEPLKLKWDSYANHYCARVSRTFPETFAAWLRTVPARISVKLEGELDSLAGEDVAGTVQLHLEEAGIDWFDLSVGLEVSDVTLTEEETRLLLNARGRYVRLSGKGWRRLRFDWGEEDDDRLARLGISPRELSAEKQRVHALQLSDQAASRFLPAEQVEQIRRRVTEIQARAVPSLPRGVTAQLRPYQLEGFHFLTYLSANRFGGILADDMGLGKTLQTLAWLLWLREQAGAAVQPARAEVEAEAEGGQTLGAPPSSGPCAASLVVCPKSVMDNWQAEAERFTPGLRVRVWRAPDLGGFRAGVGAADLHVLNYAQLRSLGKTLANLRFQAVILDEGQYIKNPGSQTSQVARALCAEHRLVLTGTPIENRLLDLWSLMAFAMPGVLGSRNHFGRIYDAKDDPLARRRLAARVRPFLIRRTKAQVARDLPERIEEDLFCEIEGEQQALYRAELKRAQQLLLAIRSPKELADQQFHFLVSLLRLRQICCHPRLVSPESEAASAKTEALFELLEPVMEEGHKVLVFSQFVTLLDLLLPALQARGWTVFYLAGGTEDRGEVVRQFQAASGPAIFLVSLKAGGFGLNLTAATYVVLFDPWWNPAVESQAIDRTHRIGQTSTVNAYRLLIKGSVEEKIRRLQRVKSALVQDVLGEERFAQSLTLEDLKFVFGED